VAVMMAEENRLPALPDGWIPEGAVLVGVAKKYAEDDVWEFVLPHYAIVGRGDSFRSASKQASELLDDYFRLCAADGLTFAEVGRPMSRGWWAREIGSAAIESVRHRIRHTSARTRLLRVPADPALI
jgi:hypothetical protein